MMPQRIAACLTCLACAVLHAAQPEQPPPPVTQPPAATSPAGTPSQPEAMKAPETAQPETVGAPAGRDEFRSLTASDGSVVRYVLLEPEGYDPVRAWPTLLVLPPGDQSEEMVGRCLAMYWKAEAAKRGWVVVCPAAPAGRSFVDSGAGLVGELLDEVAKTVRSENGLVHIAGSSNGGRAAFRAALDAPGRYASLTGLPGVPPAASDYARLDRLKNVPTALLVGQGDNDYWVTESKRTSEQVRALGGECSLRVVPGQAHVLTLEPGELFDLLNLRRPAARAAQIARDAASKAIGLVLDDFHDAAAKADGERYFAHFAPGAVFLGTDPAERWTVEEFKEWSRPYFERETAWTYTAGRRSVGVSPDGASAWFDEDLQNAKLGRCRGTGALVRTDRGWRITQYNLTVPVPNDLMGKVVEMMRAGSGQ
ncbi:MAG: alpha/beta family hydrolase [Phycisphaerales bacterium]